MNPYNIDVSKVEELQMIGNIDELDNMFERAKRTIVNGEPVLLLRSQRGGGPPSKFDELTTLEDLEAYRAQVYKYL